MTTVPSTARRLRAPRHPTRGKTAPGRLRRLDAFLALTEGALLRGDGAGVVVDLGFGAEPWTTLEWARAIARVDPNRLVVGVEADPARVAAAVPHADDRVRFEHGGFDLGALNRPVRLARAMNVLRQYDEGEVEAAHTAMGRALVDGGLLVEGTSDPLGRVMVVELLRRRSSALELEGILFACDPARSASPEQFPPVLPKRLIHRMGEDSDVRDFFERWRDAYRAARSHAAWGPRAQWIAVARTLALAGTIDPRPRLIRRGWLVWRGAPGGRYTIRLGANPSVAIART